jgi:hypothetical protein
MTILLRESSLWKKSLDVVRIVVRDLYRVVIPNNTIAVRLVAKLHVSAAGESKSTPTISIIVRTSNVQIRAGNNVILTTGVTIARGIRITRSVIVNSSLSVIGGIIRRFVKATRRLLQLLQRVTRWLNHLLLNQALTA